MAGVEAEGGSSTHGLRTTPGSVRLGAALSTVVACGLSYDIGTSPGQSD